MVHLALGQGIWSNLSFFLQINSVYSFSGCLGNLQLNGASITSASQTFSVTPCFEGPMETGTYFSTEGGYVVLGNVTALVWLWSAPAKLELKLAPPGQHIQNGALWEVIRSLERWTLFSCEWTVHSLKTALFTISVSCIKLAPLLSVYTHPHTPFHFCSKSLNRCCHHAPIFFSLWDCEPNTPPFFINQPVSGILL